MSLLFYAIPFETQNPGILTWVWMTRVKWGHSRETTYGEVAALSTTSVASCLRGSRCPFNYFSSFMFLCDL